MPVKLRLTRTQGHPQTGGLFIVVLAKLRRLQGVEVRAPQLAGALKVHLITVRVGGEQTGAVELERGVRHRAVGGDLIGQAR